LSQAETHSPPDRRSAHALDFAVFLPAALTFLAQRISTTASAVYRPKYGVGITDWRIMALLGAEPWIAPVRIAEATGLDKAAVSRSLEDLRNSGLIESDGEPGRRRNRVALTDRGLAMHDELVELALERERKLLDGFTKAERTRLMNFVGRMLKSIDAL
jgi:DNA-binding MarR family transcriptional regulator